MKRLYAPWRSSYARAIVSNAKREDTSQNACVFCTQFKESNDYAHGIVRRFNHTAIMLNKYPYNAGHLMILPLVHVATLVQLTVSARQEIIELASHAQQIVTDVLGADGVNVGINFGKAAGAGIPAHMHVHVLPRFAGDTNFMPTLCNTKTVSFDLGSIYTELKPAFDGIKL